MKYAQFIFESYDFDPQLKKLSLHYGLDNAAQFTETFTFDFEFAETIDSELLDVAFQTLFFLAGVSYYKMYLPPEIVVRQGQIDKETADFLNRTYQYGLGEFFYVNNLDPRSPVQFPINTEGITVPPFTQIPAGKLVGIGGGKDSLVSLEALHNETNVSTWSLNHRPQLTPLIEAIGLPHKWVEREWDSQIAVLNKADAYNGHIPISALFAAVGTIVAVLSGIRDVVVSNESSANEPTLTYQGLPINHQYSKSLTFEQDYQAYLAHRFNGSLRYYSLLRPFTELRIAELFAKFSFEKYKSVFSSCNRAYVHGQTHMSWCGQCSKCAFVFLVLTPFVERLELEGLWGGKNLLLDPNLETTYKQLLGIEGDKPLDCIGEIKESRAAMRLAQQTYPELSTYEFELPADYDFRALAPHSIPEDTIGVLDNLQ